ncbi:prolyl-tRNA synthetase associated domain-containing protein [Anaerovorax odorimutans]|uniref:Prolyl-tRNA synthetase associated domain-containing protein n=1 Tax=Anaerovorax odorimutans TaxID=109327 RepID=A0ABT1RJJ7_9FIRM|nr:prolyl-tRNA synthetase associated domain-containing protein [Anaerovorax odorimutans]MCQ4635352.1 prolyl-tRNA synthetase associated domain-containing protein [Anaerovorax odorimutans]
MKKDGKNARGQVYQALDELKISYQVHEHEAFFTVAEADEKGYALPGLNLKNLFIKHKKGPERWLVILEDHCRLDFKALGKLTGWGNKAAFAGDEELMRCLGLTPGSVGPFGLLNDREHQVIVVLGKAVCDAEEGTLVNFHPNDNTATLSLTKKDFLKFLRHMGNPVIFEI